MDAKAIFTKRSSLFLELVGPKLFGLSKRPKVTRDNSRYQKMNTPDKAA